MIGSYLMYIPFFERELCKTFTFSSLEIVTSGIVPVVINDNVFLNRYSLGSPNGYQLDTSTATLTTINVHHTPQLKFHFSLGRWGDANNHFTK